MNQKEQENFEKKMTDFCYSIQVVNKFFDEDGKRNQLHLIVGVYIVLNKKEQKPTNGFMTTSLTKILEISEKTAQFLYKSF